MKTLFDFSAQTGLPDDVWQSLAREIKEAAQPIEKILEIRKLIPGIAELALEAGKYQMALDFGLQRQFDQAKAFLFLGRTVEVERMQVSVFGNETQILLIQLMRARMAGKVSEALSILQNVFQNEDLVLQDHDQLELELQTGSLYFTMSDYDKAFQAYKRAYEAAEGLNLKGKMAIAAFNAAVALNYLKRELETKTWLWYSENILSKYHLTSLKLSVQLWKAEKALAEGKFLEASQGSLELLQNELSVVQKVLSLQTLAQAQMEMGQISESESTLTQSRSVINKNHYFQFEGFQQALELNLEVLLYRKIQRSSFVGKSDLSADQRVQLRMKIAQGRKAQLHGDDAKVEKVLSELEKQSTIAELHFEDLHASLHGALIENPSTARSAQAALMLAIKKKKANWIQALPAKLENGESNPWKEILSLFAGAISLMTTDKSKAAPLFSKAIVLSEKLGFERMVSLCLGFAAYCDSHRQFDWFDHLSNLEATDRRWLQDFFMDAIGINLVKGSWMIAADEKKILPQNSKVQGNYDLIIDEKKGSVSLHGSEMPLTAQSILFPILKAIASSGLEGLSKEALVSAVWGYTYDPSVHDSLIYTNVRRLRDLIPIDLYQGNYRLASEIRWCLISDSQQAVQLELNDRQRQILKTLRANSLISRKQVVSQLDISERTALRELTDMVEKRLLVKSGNGRGVTYRLADSITMALNPSGTENL